MFYYNDGPTTTLIFGQTLKTVHDRDKSSRYQGHRQLNNQHVYLSYAFCNMNVIFANFGVLTYPKVQKTFIHKTYHANY